MASYKFLGVKTINGKQVAQIKMTMVSQGESSITGSGTINLNAADGLLHDMNIVMNYKMSKDAQPMKFLTKTVRQ
jgi:hypothetical protein